MTTPEEPQFLNFTDPNSPEYVYTALIKEALIYDNWENVRGRFIEVIMSQYSLPLIQRQAVMTISKEITLTRDDQSISDGLVKVLTASWKDAKINEEEEPSPPEPMTQETRANLVDNVIKPLFQSVILDKRNDLDSLLSDSGNSNIPFPYTTEPPVVEEEEEEVE